MLVDSEESMRAVDPQTEEPIEDPSWSDAMYYGVECLDYAYPGETAEDVVQAMIDAASPNSTVHVPAGTYRAVALDYLEEGRHEDAGLLAELRDAASSFTLGEGEARTLTLTTQQLPTPR